MFRTKQENMTSLMHVCDIHMFAFTEATAALSVSVNHQMTTNTYFKCSDVKRKEEGAE